MNKYLVQDIEAIPETEVQDMWEKDRARRLELGKSVDFEPIWAFKVICIGMLVLDENLHPVKGGCAAGGCAGDKTEREMIERWSQVASGAMFQCDPLRMVDWSGRGFDVPVLQTRAFRYGIPLPWYFGLQPDNRGGISQWSKEYRDRYQGKHDDVAELWTNRGSFPKPHLATLARLMGLPGKVGIDGSQVYGAFKEKRFVEIDTYCMQDVFETAFIFQRFQYMTGALTLEEYRAAAAALLNHIRELPEQESFVAGVDLPTVMLES